MQDNIETGPRRETAEPEDWEQQSDSEPEMELDQEEAVRESRSVDELIANLKKAGMFEGQSGEKLAATAQIAENFLQNNLDLIIEGVLNTSDDISNRENYVEGSNVEIRNQLGAKVGAIKNRELEKLLRDLMKKEMAVHLHANERRLSETAIKRALTLPSLFEVVKRFRQIKDGEKIFLRAELSKTASEILALDAELDRKLRDYSDKGMNPDTHEVEDLYNQVLIATDKLPATLNIKSEVSNRLLAKVKELRSHIFVEKISSESNSSGANSGPGLFKKAIAGFRGWFKR